MSSRSSRSPASGPRSSPRQATRWRPYGTGLRLFWATAVSLLCLIFVVTPNGAALGPKSVNYLLTLAPAAGAGMALLAMHSRPGQLAVALAVATVAQSTWRE